MYLRRRNKKIGPVSMTAYPMRICEGIFCIAMQKTSGFLGGSPSVVLPQPMYKNPLFTIVWTKRDPLFDKMFEKRTSSQTQSVPKACRHHSLFYDLKPVLQQQPVLREGPSKLPVADAPQIKLLEQIEFCIDGSCVFKPDDMLF